VIVDRRHDAWLFKTRHGFGKGALLDEVLDQTIIDEAVGEAVRLLQGDDGGRANRLAAIERELATAEQERARLVQAIASGVGGTLDELVQALGVREERRATLEAERTALRTVRRVQPSDVTKVRRELLALAAAWRRVLAKDPGNGRPMISALLKGRVTITPTARKGEWTRTGEGTIAGLFERVIFPSPTPIVGDVETPKSGRMQRVGSPVRTARVVTVMLRRAA
jgi:hypothetical protein